MDNNITSIAIENSVRLARLSAIFCQTNGINNVAPEMADAFAEAMIASINEWYNENEGRNFNPMTELVKDDAVKYAFERMQGILALAQLAAMVGITPADLEIEN